MTVCLYGNNGQYPFLISDCVARSAEDSEPCLPDDEITSTSLENHTQPPLVSKVFFYDQTAVSFAGNSKNILDFIKRGHETIRQVPPNKRPMEHFSNLVSNYSQSPMGGPISCLGASFLETENVGRVNVIHPPECWSSDDTKAFGPMYAIGTGAKALGDKLLRFENNAQNTYGEELKKFSWDALVGAVGAANGNLFFGLHPEQRRTWGGYLQCAIFDYQTYNWRVSPSWLYLQILVLPDGIRTLERVFLYQCVKESFCEGEILSIWFDKEGQGYNCRWPIIDARPNTKRRSFNWQGFSPECITIAFTCLDKIEPKLILRTLSPTERDLVHFETDGTDIDLNIPDDLLDTLVNEVRSA